MKCHKCKKKISFFEAYGYLLQPFKFYCQECWYKKLLKEAREETKYWKERLKELVDDICG